MHEDFVRRKHGEVPVTYLLTELEPILRETYGVIFYQEQVMQIAATVSGFSLAEADILRRAMGKKIPEVMAAQRERFVSGAVARGIPKAKAEALFTLIEKFAGYGFNKSHSAAYALIAYQTAYLKITLAGAFDPGFDARALFPSIVESLEKSQSLRQDLWSLRLFVKEALERKGNLELDALIGRLLEFRETSMRHLMYRDWGEFERLSDEIVTAGSTMEVRVLLRKLVSYVETLVQEVPKRSVLQSVEPLSGQ